MFGRGGWGGRGSRKRKKRWSAQQQEIRILQETREEINNDELLDKEELEDDENNENEEEKEGSQRSDSTNTTQGEESTRESTQAGRNQTNDGRNEHNDMKICTFNVRLARNFRLESVLRELKQMNMDLAVLRETNLTNNIYTRSSQGYQVSATNANSAHKGE